jgi:hypothetical protein
VLAEHCDRDQDQLRLVWPSLHFIVRYDDGREFELQPNMVTEQEATVGLRIENRERIFRKGEVIQLEPHDIAEICLMVKRDAQELVNGITAIARCNDVEVHGPES